MGPLLLIRRHFLFVRPDKGGDHEVVVDLFPPLGGEVRWGNKKNEGRLPSFIDWR